MNETRREGKKKKKKKKKGPLTGLGMSDTLGH